MRRGAWPSALWRWRLELAVGLEADVVTRLPQIQEAFQHFLLTGEPAIAPYVLGTGRVPVETRLAIYGDGYRTRLIEVLQATYPVLAEVLGEADFETLGSRYVAANPSTFFSARYYGDCLAGFLASHAEYSSAPLLSELAGWEWAMAAVFDAADAPALGVEALAQVAPEHWAELQFGWAPAAQVLQLSWNVPQLWKAVTEAGARPDPAYNGTGTSWLLWRRDLQIYFRALSEEEAAAIAASRDGRSFGELCVALSTHLDEEDASLRAAGFLRGWVESGLIVSAQLPSLE